MTVTDDATRPLRALTVPSGSGVLEVLLPALDQALTGCGPALMPMPARPQALRESMLETLRPDLPVQDAVALVVPTSGSTGEPKGVLLDAAALKASAEATLQRLGGPGRWLLAMSPTHIAGMQVLVRSLVAGTEPVVLDLSDGFDPESFAAATVRMFHSSGRRYTAVVPTQLARIMAAGGAPLDALRSYHAVLIGGAATPEPLLQRAAMAGVPVVTTYGMSETSGGCVYDGRPLAGVRIAIDDEGHITVAGPTLTRGYRFDDELTGRTIKHGWFTTADLGSIADTNLLTVLGRSDDVILSGGVNVPLPVVEALLAEHPALLQAACVGVPDPEWGQRVTCVVVPKDPLDPPSLSSIRAFVSHRHPGAYAPRQLVVVDALPLLGNGKVDRLALHRLVSAPQVVPVEIVPAEMR